MLYKDADTGASDVALDPHNPRIVFAGLWQARRRPWELVSGGPGSGLYVSRDGGDTWKRLTGHGLPEGIWGKVGVAVAPSDAQRVYALIEAEEGGLFRSDDGGETWTLASDHRALRQRAWYYSTLTVDPRNADVVWFPQVPLLRTIDGGRTIQRVKGPHHGDHHDVWIDPLRPAADDRGATTAASTSRATAARPGYAAPLPISQFYHVAADIVGPVPRDRRDAGPRHGLGPEQQPRARTGITLGDWHGVGGGEAGFARPRPDEPGRRLRRRVPRHPHALRPPHRPGAQRRRLAGRTPPATAPRTRATASSGRRRSLVSPHDPKVVYHGGNVLFRSDDGGQTWTVISPDLTRNDRAKQRWSGGPITGDNTGVEYYCTIFALAESPLEQGLSLGRQRRRPRARHARRRQDLGRT